MKPVSANQRDRHFGSTRTRGAFSLTELLTVVAIFTILVAGMVSSQLFGMRMYNLSQTKLMLTANARKVLNRVRDEVRAGQLVAVGTANSSSFTVTPDNTPRIGNALKIYPDIGNTNNYVYYYLDAGSLSLKRVVSGQTGQPEILANNITNNLAFQAEDYQGNVVSNDQNNEVIGINLFFRQREYYPTATNGPMYGYYQLQTRVSQRVN